MSLTPEERRRVYQEKKARLTCRVEWSEPRPWRVLRATNFATANYVYAIVILDRARHSVLRIGASKNFAGRLRQYAILDYIPNARISYYVISEEFKRQLKPRLERFYVEHNRSQFPPFLNDRPPAYCVERDLWAIEYRVESLLLGAYKNKHRNLLPPGNAMTGAHRPYLDGVAVEERGLRVLDLSPARLAPIKLEEAQLLRLLGGRVAPKG